MRRTIAFATVALVLLSAPAAMAGGFLLYEHNASATGMADARTGLAGDPSSVYYNPAAITELEGLQLQLGVTGILPYVHYDAAGQSDRVYQYMGTDGLVEKPINDGMNSIDAKIKFFNPIHIYATYSLSDYGLSFGYGLNNPFGLGTYWPGEWDGRFIGTETEIQTFYNNPVVAVDLAKLFGFKEHFKLSVALGYMFVYGTARLSKRIDLRVAEALSGGQIVDPWGEMRMTGDAIGHGFNAALYAEWPDLVSFGFSMRSGVSMPFEGTAKFIFPTESGQAARDFLAAAGTVFPDATTGAVTIDLPYHFNTGVAYLGVENLKIALDFYMVFFSSYDQLHMAFDCVADGSCSSALDTTIEKNWHSCWQLSLGAEYMLFDFLPLRVGYGMVTTPVPSETYDPSLPDGRRDLICLGTGYHGSWWKLDIGYMLALWQGEKDNEVGIGDALNPEGMANGTYTTQAHLLALTFTAAI
ncbi:MAG: outer membrane protein transport protein [Deltaproteobacteria bacterium]|nr:outer membrane protein transport protein [Deltaproteobacteria bacterium]